MSETQAGVQPIEVSLSIGNLIDLIRRGRTKTRQAGTELNEGHVYRLTLENRHLLSDNRRAGRRVQHTRRGSR